MTDGQAHFLRDLCQKAGRDFDPTLSKGQAGRLIRDLKVQLGMEKKRTPNPHHAAEMARRKYVTTVADEWFRHARGTPIRMPSAWRAIIGGMHDDGVPLDEFVAAVTEAFDYPHDVSRPEMYFRHACALVRGRMVEP